MKKVKHIVARKIERKPITARPKRTENVRARQKKITSIRTELCDGCYMMTYYFRRGMYGELIAEDIDYATDFERVVYDARNRVIGSTSGQLTDKIRW